MGRDGNQIVAKEQVSHRTQEFFLLESSSLLGAGRPHALTLHTHSHISSGAMTNSEGKRAGSAWLRGWGLRSSGHDVIVGTALVMQSLHLVPVCCSWLEGVLCGCLWKLWGSCKDHGLSLRLCCFQLCDPKQPITDSFSFYKQ